MLDRQRTPADDQGPSPNADDQGYFFGDEHDIPNPLGTGTDHSHPDHPS